jgi:uncharacterized LabA/DUF88 family protein
MPEAADSRVAVYIDFDNIVISRYSQVHPKNQRDQLRKYVADGTPANDAIKQRLDAATVDIGAILDYASSFGTIVISRAYADWSQPVNALYQRQLISRAVDLTQMFPTSATKNGADIRLAVDVVEDLFRLDTITHVVIVAGDSDYISLAQRAKRLDRYVVGIGVAGSVSSSLADACNEFADYDSLPGVTPPVRTPVVAAVEPEPEVEAAPTVKAPTRSRRASSSAAAPVFEEPAETTSTVDVTTVPPRKLQADRDEAARLLARALRLGHEKDDEEWLHAAAVKQQMKRMDPKFNEKALGYSTFSEFVKSRPKMVEMREEGQSRMVRLR